MVEDRPEVDSSFLEESVVSNAMKLSAAGIVDLANIMMIEIHHLRMMEDHIIHI